MYYYLAIINPTAYGAVKLQESSTGQNQLLRWRLIQALTASIASTKYCY